jgi:hypothetical protein
MNDETQKTTTDQIVYARMLRLKFGALMRQCVTDPAVRMQYINGAANLRALAARLEAVTQAVRDQITLDEAFAAEAAAAEAKQNKQPTEGADTPPQQTP